MKRFLFTTAIVLTLLAVLFFSTALFCFKSNYIHQIDLSRVNTLIPGTITPGNIRISLLSKKLEIIELAVADSSGRKPAGFKRLFVDISPRALIHRKLIIQDADITDPWVILDIDKNGQFTLINAFIKPDTLSADTVKKTHGGKNVSG